MFRCKPFLPFSLAVLSGILSACLPILQHQKREPGVPVGAVHPSAPDVIRSDGRTLTSLSARNAAISKGSKDRTSAPLVEGDRVDAKIQFDANSILIATEIRANLVKHSGSVCGIERNGFRVLLLQKRPDQQGFEYRNQENVELGREARVWLDRGPRGPGKLSDLQQGEFVEYIGSQLLDGRVVASTLYMKGKWPVNQTEWPARGRCHSQ